MKENIKVVVLDSGINNDHKCFEGEVFSCFSIDLFGNVSKNNCEDEIGHGTAVSFIIHKHLSSADMICFKIVGENFYNSKNLILSLKYIYEYIPCDIINISLGVTCCDNLEELYNICEMLNQRGTILVSAFDNSGILSYPAAFDNVIGVDVSNSVNKLFNYEYVENSAVNIRGYNREQNLPWLDNDYSVVSGASFAAPYITVQVGKFLESGIRGFHNLLHKLKTSATNIYECKNVTNQTQINMQNAIAFPFNKEMHSLARFSNMLHVNILDFFDVKYIGNIGKNISDVLGVIYGNDYIIKNYLTVNWTDNFDSVILGHTGDLSRILNKNFEEYFVKKCIEFKKSIYSFSALSEDSITKLNDNNIRWFYPGVTAENVPQNTFGKLRKISNPIVAVVGTGQRQGKFTLQLKLKMLFEQSGYTVGMLGTEPSSILFGADEIYPMGYDSTVNVSGYEAIIYINSLMGKIENRNPDLIIVGSQSQTVPITDGWIGFYPIKQHEFLLGCVPDCYILCVNVNDDLNYIQRTINYLEGIFPSKVICIALFPFATANKWSVIGTSKIMVENEIISTKINEMKKQFKKNVYNLGDDLSVYKIAKECIRYFK